MTFTAAPLSPAPRAQINGFNLADPLKTPVLPARLKATLFKQWVILDAAQPGWEQPCSEVK